MIASLGRWFSAHWNAMRNLDDLETASVRSEAAEERAEALRVSNGCIADQMKLVRSNNASLREALSRPENPPSPRRYTLTDLRDEIEALKKTAPRYTADTIKTPHDARHSVKKRPKKKKK